MGKYMAIDIGEKSGNMLLGYLAEGKLQIEKIHEFDKVSFEKDGDIYWDFPYIINEIKTGLKKCKEAKKLPIFVGINTEGLDFILLDHEDNIIGDTAARYGSRIEQKLKTIVLKYPDILSQIGTFLLLPDYLNFLLTGRKTSELTNAMATQLVDPVTKSWDEEIIKRTGAPIEIFPEIHQPGSVLGTLARDVTEEVGFDCIIMLPATNHNSSAVLAVPSNDQRAVPYHFRKENEEVTGTINTSALGVFVVLMICSHEFSDLQAARECIKNSMSLT
jgi:rhamnulokinase